MIFTKQEMQVRRQVFCKGLQNMGVDVVIIHSSDNSYYLSGVPLLSEWGRPMWSVLCANGQSALIGAIMEKENMEQYNALDEILCYDDSQTVVLSATELAVDFIHRQNIKVRKLGIEEGLLPLSLYKVLISLFPEVELVDISPILQEQRIIKSDEEIRLLRLGGEVALVGAAAFVDTCREYSTELEISSRTVLAMNMAIAALSPQYPESLSSSYCFCQLGTHSLTPHLHASSRRLHKGDVVSMNVFPVILGYCMALERTFIFGEPTSEQLRALKAVTESAEIGRAALAPGVLPSSVDKLCYDYLRDAGYGDECFRHGTGHSQGIMIGSAGREELGDVRSYNHRPFSVHQFVTIEPSIYLPGIGGFRHNDVMLIEDNKVECLTAFNWDIGACLGS